MGTVFSKRHKKGIYEKKITVSIPVVVRNRIWSLLKDYDYSYYYQPDPHNSWTETETMLGALPEKIEAIHGGPIKGWLWDESQGAEVKKNVSLEGLIKHGSPTHVWDALELAFLDIKPDNQNRFQKSLNQIFEEEDLAWRFVEGEFFAIDSKFLTERIYEKAFELMRAGGFEGALDEFRKAMDFLTAGDYQNAIHNASNSFESTLKKVLGTDHGTAKELIKGLKDSGFYSGIPENVGKEFGNNVFSGLPFLRNRLGGHGQGEDVIEIPKVFAELAVNLAGSFLVFIIENYIDKEESDGSDEIVSDF